MSLLIVGSASKITQNIVHQLARNNVYKSITITDLLPTYCFHSRYYQLKKSLVQYNSQTTIDLNKLTRIEELYRQIQQSQDILYVTHDYFQSVTSKTKLMQLTAQHSKNKKNVIFATPLEYDHFGYENPGQNYLKSQSKVQQINNNATFVRSDIQDGAQTLAYLHQSKGFIEQVLFSVPDSFAPRLYNSKLYAERVAQALINKQKGKIQILTSDQSSDYKSVSYDKQINHKDTSHFKNNVKQLLKKYTGLERVASSTK